MTTLVKSLLDNPGIRFRPEHTAVNLLKRGSDWQVTGTTNGKDISLPHGKSCFAYRRTLRLNY